MGAASLDRPSPVPAKGDCVRLLDFLHALEAEGELERVGGRTSLRDVARRLDATAGAVLFESAGPEGHMLAGNVLSSRARLARAFGAGSRNLLREVRRRLATPQEVFEVVSADAPVHQVVLTDAADVTRLPANLQHALDGAPYISAAIDFARDEATGHTNVGLRRLMVRGPRETGIDLVAPSDLRAIYQARQARGESLPLSIVVGSHPVDYFAATMRLPGDELALMATLRGAAMPVVRCVTNDLLVPADAEWVIEGHLGAEGYVEPEGPFGEFLGYYGEVKTNPVFHVTAITRRQDAVFQTLTIGGRSMAATDTAQLCALRTEVLVWRALETAVREPVEVHAVPASGGVYNVRLSLRQRVPGEARNAIAAVFGSVANVKNVFVVDPDIDVFSGEHIDWALGTRFQPDRDLVVAEGFRTLPLDPSLDGAVTGSKAGFDLTFPFGGGEGLAVSVPEPPTFEGTRFASVEAALADGPKAFAALMAAIGSEDGRDVLLALEALRARGVLRRDADRGLYLLDTAS
jgi:2,5-furandicarboxylate decarboxylase 1